MSRRPWIPLTLCAAAALATACGSPPKEPVFATQDDPIEEPLPPPPKKKECKALDEECVAKAKDKAKIANSDLMFKPPKGWTYAQGESATIAQTGPEGVVIAMTQADVEDPKKEAEARDAAIEALAKEINATLPKKKPNWRKPDDTKEIGDLKLALWQMDGGARGEKKGLILLLVGPVTDGKLLVGVSYSPGDDEAADAALLESIDSIAASGK